MLITCPYETHAETKSHRLAISTENEQLTYKSWYERVRKTAAWLQNKKLSKGRIGILLENPIEFLQVFAGAAHAGLIAVPLNPRWSRQELMSHVKRFDLSLVLTSSSLSFKPTDFRSELFIRLDECKAEIEKTEQIPKPLSAGGDIPFYMGFTSGSSGKPKAFLRSQKSWVKSFECNVKDFQMTDSEYVVVPGSLFHSHFLYGAISTLYLGGTVYVSKTFQPHHLLSVLESQPVTVLYVVPTMVEALLKEKQPLNHPIKVISSGAKWGQHAKLKMKEAFPSFSLWEFYGASELSFVSVLSEGDQDQKPTSVGKPCHNVMVEVRRDDRTVASLEELGKIYVKSPLQFLGYLNETGELKYPGDDGWLTVGDMGHLDADGYLHIAGRENHMILYGAMNIFPEEIEAVLNSHPAVEEAAVIGVPNPYWGQLVTAVIIGDTTAKALKAFCKTRLSSYKIPRRWHFVDELPHTVSGKVAKKELEKVIPYE